MELFEISQSLKAAGIDSGDTVMLHGDSIVAAQLRSIPDDRRLQYFFEEVLNYLGKNGTLVIPSFSYSFTSSEKFDVLHSPSKVGKFSECFRSLFPKLRSKNPLFSVVAVGRLEEEFKSASVIDCFGEDSCFGMLKKYEAKLMCLGCNFNQVTFFHHVEQTFGVSYRYFKWFSGEIINGNHSESIKTRYYVGNTELNYTLNLNRLKNDLIANQLLKMSPFGRIGSYAVSAVDFYNNAEFLLRKNEYSLIEEGNYGSP